MASAATTSTSDGTNSFSLFSKFPIEIRLKIWKLAPEARIIEVLFQGDHRKRKYKFYAAGGNVPALLHVNHEARIEGLQLYKEAFGSKWALNKVYFDYEIDALSFPSYSGWEQKVFFFKKTPSADLAQVQNIILHNPVNMDYTYLRFLIGLKELSIIIRNGLVSRMNTPKMQLVQSGRWFDLEGLSLMTPEPDERITLHLTAGTMLAEARRVESDIKNTLRGLLGSRGVVGGIAAGVITSDRNIVSGGASGGVATGVAPGGGRIGRRVGGSLVTGTTQSSGSIVSRGAGGGIAPVGITSYGSASGGNVSGMDIDNLKVYRLGVAGWTPPLRLLED